MILRIVRGRIAVNRVEGLTAAFGASSDGHARVTPGLVRSHVGVRPLAGDEREVVLVTCWETVDAAIAADDGELVGLARLSTARRPTAGWAGSPTSRSTSPRSGAPMPRPTSCASPWGGWPAAWTSTSSRSSASGCTSWSPR